MKISVFIATSLDGFIARENGDLDWLPGSDGNIDPEMGQEDYGYHAFMNSVDTLVMGRHTFEKVLSFSQWPYGDKRVIVLSKSMRELPGRFPKTVKIHSGPPEKLIAELQKDGANHLYVDGGKTIQGFLKAEMIDELILTRIPVLIGKGIPLFGPMDNDLALKHIKTVYYKNGFVQTTYKVIKGYTNF